MNNLSIEKFFNNIVNEIKETLLKRFDSNRYIEIDNYIISINDRYRIYYTMDIEKLYDKYKDGLSYEECIIEACKYINNNLLSINEFIKVIRLGVSKDIIIRNIKKTIFKKKIFEKENYRKFYLEYILLEDNKLNIKNNMINHDTIIDLNEYYNQYLNGKDIRELIILIRDNIIDFNNECTSIKRKKKIINILKLILMISGMILLSLILGIIIFEIFIQ